MPYATFARLKSERLPQADLTTNTKPTEVDITTWLTAAQTMLDQALKAKGLPAPYTDGSAQAIILGELCLDYAEGRARRALASVFNDGENDDGDTMLGRFDDALKMIRENGALVGEMLAGTPSVGTRTIKGTAVDVTDTADEDNSDSWFTRSTEL